VDDLTIFSPSDLQTSNYASVILKTINIRDVVSAKVYRSL